MPHVWFSIQQVKKKKKQQPYCIWLTGLMVLREKVFGEEGGGAKNNNKMKDKVGKLHCLPDTFEFSPPGKFLDKNWLSLLACAWDSVPDTNQDSEVRHKMRGGGGFHLWKQLFEICFLSHVSLAFIPRIRCTWWFSTASAHHLVLITLYLPQNWTF